jgi:NADH:ubiquinone oxidoreductase subunit D
MSFARTLWMIILYVPVSRFGHRTEMIRKAICVKTSETLYRGFRVPRGEVYAAVEAPKGEFGVY